MPLLWQRKLDETSFRAGWRALDQISVALMRLDWGRISFS